MISVRRLTILAIVGALLLGILACNIGDDCSFGGFCLPGLHCCELKCRKCCKPSHCRKGQECVNYDCVPIKEPPTEPEPESEEETPAPTPEPESEEQPTNTPVPTDTPVPAPPPPAPPAEPEDTTVIVHAEPGLTISLMPYLHGDTPLNIVELMAEFCGFPISEVGWLYHDYWGVPVARGETGPDGTCTFHNVPPDWYSAIPPTWVDPSCPGTVGDSDPGVRRVTASLPFNAEPGGFFNVYVEVLFDCPCP